MIRRLAAVVALVLTASGPCHATEVRVGCDRLSREQQEELRARISLTLRAGDAPPESIWVACDDAGVWVTWVGPPSEVLEVAAGESVIDGVIAAVERRLAAPPATPPTAREDEARKPPPRAARAASRQVDPVPRRRLFRVGGLGLSLSSELLTAPLAPTFGPRLDVGVGMGPIWFSFQEAFRYGSAEPDFQTESIDVALGLGFGAPFDRKWPFGVAAFAGADSFIVHTGRRNVGSATLSSGVAGVGARGAVTLGEFALFAVLDGRYRFAPQSFGSPIDLDLPRFALNAGLGCALLIVE